MRKEPLRGSFFFARPRRNAATIAASRTARLAQLAHLGNAAWLEPSRWLLWSGPDAYWLDGACNTAAPGLRNSCVILVGGKRPPPKTPGMAPSKATSVSNFERDKL